MREYLKFYIDGEWVAPSSEETKDVVAPGSGAVSGRIARGSIADLDKAVAAARRALPAFSATSREERIDLLMRIKSALERRYDEMAQAISDEMGAPLWLASKVHAALAIGHLDVAVGVLKDYPFEEYRGSTLIRREPVGVCALITPWNWPLHQIATKVVPALAAGCTMILKPAELSPYSAQIWTEILHEAGVPPGVFNLLNGRGKVIGAAMSEHPDIDMISFTGSTSAGVEVARAAAATVKRVCQELGGKSANIILDDADFEKVIPAAVQGVMMNSGQTCSALTRLLVPAARLEEAERLAAVAARSISVGSPSDNAQMGPLVSIDQWETVQRFIASGIEEGAHLVSGGLGRPEGVEGGAYARPTVFSRVTSDMTIAREEIFGPVLSIIAYDDVDDAVAIANDSPYGLSGGVQSASLERARAVAARLRTGQVFLNGADVDFMAPFGGYKQSGNGREWGDFAFSEFVEIKAVMGAAGAS